MKRSIIGFAFFCMVIATTAIGKSFWKGDVMSLSQVQSRWGSGPFDASKFKSGDYKTRAKMAHSVVHSRVAIGKSREEIVALLGDWDGYYFSDSFPAYIIHDGRIEKSETWQLVFLLDKSRKVSEVIVHKN